MYTYIQIHIYIYTHTFIFRKWSQIGTFHTGRSKSKSILYRKCSGSGLPTDGAGDCPAPPVLHDLLVPQIAEDHLDIDMLLLPILAQDVAIFADFWTVGHVRVFRIVSGS